MSKKIPLALAIALIFLFSALTVILTVSIYLRTYTKSLIRFGEQTKQFATLTEIEALVRANYVGKIDASKENTATAKGYVQGLNDRNAAYFTPEEYAQFARSAAGQASGAGIQTQFSGIQNALIVTSVAQNSPAAMQNVSVGDAVVEVNKKTVTVKNYTQLQKLLENDSEEELQIKLLVPQEENGAGSYRNISLKTGYMIPSVLSCTVGRTGYVRVSAFYEDSASRFREAVDSLSAQGITKLVVDVRNNVSTNYDVAANIIDCLVPLATDGTRAIASAIDRSGTVLKSYASDTRSVSVPVAVLINDRTQGAAELLAADLRDFLSAKLIGERTAGNAGYTETFLLEDGSALILSVAKIYPYISDCYQDTGIAPDIEIVLPDFQKDTIDILSVEEDAQFIAAVSALS